MPIGIFGRTTGGNGKVSPPGPPGLRGPRGYAGTIIDPTSAYETYIKYINLRKVTLHSLCAIAGLTVNQTVKAGVAKSLLDSDTTRKKFYWEDEDFNNKHIELGFLYPVWFNQLQFLFDRATTWQLHFVWEYFDDYQWVQIGGEYNKSYKTIEDPYLGHVMSFNQDIPFRRGNKNMSLGV